MTGTDLRAYRLSLGLSQAKLGQILGIHWNSIARMERGKMKVTPRTLERIAISQQNQMLGAPLYKTEPAGILPDADATR